MKKIEMTDAERLILLNQACILAALSSLMRDREMAARLQMQSEKTIKVAKDPGV